MSKSVRQQAAERLAQLKAQKPASKPERMSPDAKQIQNRVQAEKMPEGNVRRGRL